MKSSSHSETEDVCTTFRSDPSQKVVLYLTLKKRWKWRRRRKRRR